MLGVAVGILRKDQKRFRSLQSIFFKHWILYIAYRFLIPLLEILKKILSERLRFGARLKPPHSLLSPHYSQYWFPIIHSTGGELPWKISHSQTSNVFLHKMDNSQTISSWKSDQVLFYVKNSLCTIWSHYDHYDQGHQRLRAFLKAWKASNSNIDFKMQRTLPRWLSLWYSALEPVAKQTTKLRTFIFRHKFWSSCHGEWTDKFSL